ncbi:recombinase family protein [Actinomadura sp. ATCC 39365]
MLSFLIHGRAADSLVSRAKWSPRPQHADHLAHSCRDIVEEIISTRRKDCPKLQAVIAGRKAGDTLVITKPDRVARSVKELLVFLEDELAPRGINLHILTGICAGIHRPAGQSMADKMLCRSRLASRVGLSR